MSEIFNKSDFKNGMSFKTRYGDKCYIIDSKVYRKSDESTLELWDSSLEECLESYDDELLALYTYPHGTDIMEIYDIKNNLVWKRKEIEWNKIPVNTKVLVRNSKGDSWNKRYFAKYEDGKVFTFISGYTSWSINDANLLVSWEYAKLAEKSKNGFYFPTLDTSKIDFEVELEKLKEETEELLEAAIKYKTNKLQQFELKDYVIEESYDVIQVVVNIIDRLGIMDYMTEGLEEHIEKLKSRGWKFKNEI